MDRFGRLAELCYTGTDTVESLNLSLLLGLPSSFLNGLLRRGDAHEKGHVEAGFPTGDLISFFREPWALPMLEEAFLPFAQGLNFSLMGDDAIEELWKVLKSILAGAQKGEPSLVAAVDLACMETMAEGVGVGGTALPASVRMKIQSAVKQFLQKSLRD